ncbi:FKBP-type peptidyl-prolyl cis-trans isomerase [Flavobacterium saccharophilum]|uniref:peptidylprolyl isomerase n=1 Tax=Flavobacterium saccharophilum TaxID=29534 RepID=A0A1M7JD12_9FLAO|nr:FKBP-type peptidyl-prolyl cis-trans isomerase [Flavobacterium saccharophilum]SHM50866.1 FKBP-type peptidyl-prolyl cis-trans isomerase [Flavobacterium saccharophilum]
MNKFKYYFVLLLAGISLVSCNKSDDDDVVVVPLRDYKEQYKADNDSIEKYLKTNYLIVDKVTFDVEIKKIPAGGTQVSIWDQQEYPLEHRDVYNRDINYKVYYLTLNKGVGESPCNTDLVYAAYKGNLLDGTVFDQSYGLGVGFDLYVYKTNPVIDGWGEIFPKFKTGTSTTAADGVITYQNYGAGVMFLPSGLAYFGTPQTGIPTYAPLVFSFKLFELQRLDHDFQVVGGQRTGAPDGVLDYDEDINHDGYNYNLEDKVRFPNMPKELIDDTDGDGIADFMDFDDDGDGYSTRFEITKPEGAPVTGISKYYPFDPLPDNPKTVNTDESETYGIPAFSAAGTPDYTSPGRLRIHVDKDHHSAK